MSSWPSPPWLSGALFRLLELSLTSTFVRQGTQPCKVFRVWKGQS